MYRRDLGCTFIFSHRGDRYGINEIHVYKIIKDETDIPFYMQATSAVSDDESGLIFGFIKEEGDYFLEALDPLTGARNLVTLPQHVRRIWADPLVPGRIFL